MSEMGQGNSQHLTHTWMEKNGAKTIVYNAKSDPKGRDGRKTEKERKVEETQQ